MKKIENSTIPSTPTDLKQVIGFVTIFIILLNSIFGSSLTYNPGLGMSEAGPASIVVWILVFLIGFYIAYGLAELISIFPSSGGIYEFGKLAFGPLGGFLIGWVSWISGNIGASLAVVWGAEYFYSATTSEAFITKMLICLVVVVFINFIASFGISSTTVFFSTLIVIVLTVLLSQIVSFFIDIPTLFSGSFISHFNVSHFIPFLVHEGVFANSIYLFSGFFLIAEAFFGLESIAYLGNDIKNPKKTLPKALIYAISVAAFVMLAYVIGSIGFYPTNLYDTVSIPYKNILFALFPNVLFTNMLNIGTIILIIAPAASWVITGPRLIYSLAKDKLFLKKYSLLNKKHQTPTRAILFQTIVISMFVVFQYILYLKGHSDPYKLVFTVFIVLMFVLISSVLFIVPVLRKKFPDKKRLYLLKFPLTGSILIASLFILATWSYVYVYDEYHIIAKSLTLIFSGLPVYIMLNVLYNPEALKVMTSSSANIALWLENVMLPKKIRKKIFSLFSNHNTKTVLEFGCGVGTLTMELANAVGPAGRVYAIDFSEKNIAILSKRTKKKNINHVTIIHDEHAINRIHPSIPVVDTIFSVGAMDTIQDLKKVLKEMYYILPENGHICMVEYADYFGILPDSGWVSDLPKLKEIFKEAGFSVRIIKWKGYLWNYICVYGIKSDKEISII